MIPTQPPLSPVAGTSIDAQILDLMLRAGSRWVLWVLIALSLAAIAVVIDRVWFFIAERRPSARLAAALAALRAPGGAGAALRLLDGARSMEAEVARACLAHAADGAPAVEEYKAAALQRERERYGKRLAFLGTLGNNAPFVGLFGTVLGIIRAFNDLAGASTQGTQVVMAGIAEALVATAVGLLVALPAVATYNVFTRRLEAAEAGAEGVAHEILALLKAPAAATSAAAAPGKGG
jgi:biopolymer transport protein ExbB